MGTDETYDVWLFISSQIWRVRWWLISVLAGSRSVMINAVIIGDYIANSGIVKNTTIYPANDMEKFEALEDKIEQQRLAMEAMEEFIRDRFREKEEENV